MLARLILALMLAAFALPAATMPCHDAPMAMSGVAMAHHGDVAPARAIAAHACIGCVPPSSWRTGTLDRLMPLSRPLQRIRVATLDVGPAAPPAIPPPKSEA